MENKIYVLINSYGIKYEDGGSTILGVYSSKAKAEEAKKAYEQDNPDIANGWEDYFDVMIEDYILDDNEWRKWI